jgi:hypothetical protein
MNEKARSRLVLWIGRGGGEGENDLERGIRRERCGEGEQL